MTPRTVLLAALVIAAVTPGPAVAQPPTAAEAPRMVTMFELVLRDGTRVYGAIEAQDDAEVAFKTQGGTLVTAKRADILSLKEVTGSLLNGEFMPPDPNATRLFFGPTGRSLPKGKVYLGVYEFLMPFVQVGVTDRFSIGGGTPLVFGFGDEEERPFWITPKLQVLNTRSTQVSVGAYQILNAHGDGGGIGYVVGTRGGADASLTVGAGVAYGLDGGRAGVAMVGGERRVRRNLKVVTENYIWKNGDGVISAGIRFIGERLSADLALAGPIGADTFFLAPVVNFVYVF